MTTRILPREEYFRLMGTELEGVRDELPASACVLAVENDDGELVACWALLPIWHVEGVWIAESERKRGQAAIRLVRGMKDMARTAGAKTVMTAAVTDEVRALIQRMGGQQVPGDHFLVPVGA